MPESEVSAVQFLDELAVQIVDEFIVGGAANVAREMNHILSALVTIYVVLWGYRMLAGLAPVRGLLLEFVKLSAVLLLVTNFENYNTFVKDPLFTLPEYMASAATGSDPTLGLVGLVDRVLTSGFEVGAAYWSEAGLLLGDMGLYLLAILIWISVAIPTALAAFLLILSKIYMGVLLVFGPLVIALTLFDRTRGYFERWIIEIVNRSLVILLAILVPKIMLFYFLNNLDGIAETFRTGEGAIGSVIVIVFFSIAQILFYWQIPVVASSIAGGFQLAPTGVDRRLQNAILGLPGGYMRMARASAHFADRLESSLHETRQGGAYRGRTRWRPLPG